LTDAEATSLAPARAKRLAYSLSGRARYLYEILTGEPAVDDGGATPLNPQGRMGVDRSGPPWGDAHLHPMWSYVAMGAGGLVYPVVGGAHQQFIECDGGQGTFRRLTARFWVRPHYSAPGMPYTRAYLRGLVSRKGASGTATITVRVYGPDGESGPSTSATGSTTSATAAITLDAWCPVTPGWNERIIEIEQTSTVGSYVGPLSLNQVVRRSH